MRYELIDPNNDEKKSALDLVIVSRNLYEYVERVEVDKDLKWTPCRPAKRSVKFSDHYALLVVFKNIPKKDNKASLPKAPPIWNTNREGGWKRYQEKSDKNVKLEQVVTTSEKM